MAKISGLTRRGNKWQFRRRVPKHLREVFCKTEFIDSLSDCAFKDAARWARKRWVYYDALIADAEDRQALASDGRPQGPLGQDELSERDIRRIAVNYFLSLEDAGSEPFLMADTEQLDGQNDEELDGWLGSGPEDASVQHVALAAARQAGVEGEIAGKQLYRLSQWIYEACVEHHRRQSDRIEGSQPMVRNSAFSPDSIERIANSQCEKITEPENVQSRTKVSSSSPSIIGLFDAYAAERKPAPATVKSWRLKLESLVAFLGHDDAARVTGEDIVRWKDYLASTPTKQGKLRSAKTVREGYLAAAKAVFAHATDNFKIPTDPTLGVKIRGGKRQRLRDPGFAQNEAETILRATLRPVSSKISLTHALARRWVPWLCAYTGARVGEITQLRKQDVICEDGIWAINITPEAGSTKTNAARTVPLHSHIIEQGFLDVVNSAPKQELFYDPMRSRGGKEGNPLHKKTAERLAKWVRELGVTDRNVQPNHAWRHRFKTIGRSVKMDHEARAVIPGHSAKTEGETYGTWTLAALATEIEKMPRYNLNVDGDGTNKQNELNRARKDGNEERMDT